MRTPVLVLLCLCLVPTVGQPAAAGAASSFAQRTQHLVRRDGFVPLYWDARKGTLLLEVSRVGEEFFYGAGLSAGAGSLEPRLDRGDLGRLALCRFIRSAQNLLLEQRQIVHRASSADPEQ